MSVPDGAHYSAHGLWHHNSGKTYAGAIKALRSLRPGSLGLVVAPSFRMLRDATWRTALEVWGGHGLATQVLRGDELRVELANGAEAIFRSAEDPERLRGPSASWAWIDEGALCHPDTWPIVIGRLREHGRAGPCWVTTTPKPRNVGPGGGVNWTRRVFVTEATEETALVRATTAANPFLPPEYARSLRSQYTARLARQELEAEWVLDVEGALFTHAMIHRAPQPPDLARVVVAVDPSGGASAEHDEQGIVVCGLGADGRGYVLADRSCRLSPDGWGRRAVQAYLDFEADAIIGEGNFGGDMVQSVIRTAAVAMGVTVAYKAVHASRGKAIRAQPVAALYEQRRVSHCDVFAELEEQLTTWTPESGTSPDRLDALVWSLTGLMVKDQRQVYVY
ncbi:MAG TPA: phage terminase large subunit [Terriglobales bacterium]|nr:phage terminase large subunit [Terriglobales bacterium]